MNIIGLKWSCQLLGGFALLIASADCVLVGETRESNAISVIPRALAEGEYWSQYVTPGVAPGATYHISLCGRFHAPHDILVDFMDKTGWYANGRVTVQPGDFNFNDTKITITLPTTVQDPDSVYFSFKVLPVGGDWQSYLEENNVPVRWIAPTRVEGNLLYPGNVTAWDYTFTRNYSNHDGWSVRVGRATAGPFSGTDTISSRHFGMTGDSEDYQLNLATGEVYNLLTPPPYTNQPPVAKRLALPQDRDQMPAYTAILNAIISSVDYVADSKGSGSQTFLEYPSLKNTSDYLLLISSNLYHQWGELVALPPPDNNLPLRFSAGDTACFSVQYGALNKRDLLVDLSVNNARVSGTRVLVERGSGNKRMDLPVPATVQPWSKGIIHVKMVPPGAADTSSLAETSTQVSLTGVDHLFIWWTVNDSGADPMAVASGGTLKVQGSFMARQDMDVRVDVNNPDGIRIASSQVHGVVTNYSHTIYDYATPLTLPATAPVACGYRIHTYLVPANGTCQQSVDQLSRTLNLMTQ